MTTTTRRASEALGAVGGWVLGPLTGMLSRLRHARMFHPDGVVVRAVLEPHAAALADAPRAAVARRLEGPALVRLSAALWRGGREWPDVLGLALRARRDGTPDAVPGPDDQDLLFATIRHPWTMPFAPLATKQHDYFDNDYFAVSPFDVPPFGRALLRLVRPASHARGRDRAESLARSIASGQAAFRLEIARERDGAYAPVATLRLLERIEVDQRALEFDPFRDGRGLTPRGFVHALRTGAYAASRWGRGAPAASR